jgi:hypothetical protein
MNAVNVATAGTTIYVRGGIYSLSTTITISKIGTAGSKYYLFAYQSERPILDFSSMALSSGNRGIRLSGNYWHVKGLDIKGAGDNGMNVSGSNNIIELCTFYENRDTGLQLGGGASNNQIINCDSYFNVDPGQGNADGFAPKLDVGSGNSFYGCRSWQNSDDGWDGYLRPSNDVSTLLENCWTFKNGYLKDGAASVGNGNGFKMGGSDSTNLMHNMILRNCVAFDNRVKGFDQNNDRGSMTLYNCSSFRNGTNYSIPLTLNSGKTATVVNCLSVENYGTLASFCVQQTNSWMSPFVVTSQDFLSLDTAGVRGPRKPDGSLPDLLFLHLAPGSDLIDGGTNVGLPFAGLAPDLGAFESGGVTAVTLTQRAPRAFVVYRNYPNPFNPATTIRYEIPSPGDVSIRLYSADGRLVKELLNREHPSGVYSVQWDGKNSSGQSVSAGLYLAIVQYLNAQYTLKFVLLH